MNNRPDNLPESLWRRPLSFTERAALRDQPELEMEAQLTGVLEKIAAVPVPSNFTARVLDAVELVEKKSGRAGWSWRLLLPRMAVATAVLIFAGVSLQRYEVHSQRVALMKNIALVAVAQPLPSVDALENLDAIQRLSQSSHADGELLAALK